MTVTIPTVPDDPKLSDPKLQELADFAELARSPRAVMRLRDAKIRELRAEGYSVEALAEVTDLKPARIYQIVGPTRPRKSPPEA